MMDGFLKLISSPYFWLVVVLFLLYYLFCAIVGSLDRPDENSSVRYRHWFKFLNKLAGNLKRAALDLKLPGANTEDIQ